MLQATELCLSHNALSGTLPRSWGSPGLEDSDTLFMDGLPDGWSNFSTHRSNATQAGAFSAACNEAHAHTAMCTLLCWLLWCKPPARVASKAYKEQLASQLQVTRYLQPVRLHLDCLHSCPYA